jgi:cytochrome c oxidase subunit 2
MHDSTTMTNGSMGGSMDGMDHGKSSPVAEGARRIEVDATSFDFSPEEITVTAGEDVAIVLTADDLLHDFTIDELDAHVAAEKGETAEGGLRADEPGRYTYYCSVEGHRENGMEGTLIVETK